MGMRIELENFAEMKIFSLGKSIEYLEKGKKDYWVSFQKSGDPLGII